VAVAGDAASAVVEAVALEPSSSAHISVALEKTRPAESNPRESITPAAVAAAAAE
jgi:hypothetical protein